MIQDKITISANDPVPKFKQWKLTLEYVVQGYDCPDLPEGFARTLYNLMNYWSDGRRDLQIEIVAQSLQTLINAAIRRAIEAEERKKYGNELVRISSSHQRARACIEADARYQAFECPYLGEAPINVYIEDVSDLDIEDMREQL